MQPITSKYSARRMFWVLGVLVLSAGAVGEELEEVIVSGNRDLLSQNLMQTLSVKVVDSTTQLSQNRTIGDWLATHPALA